MADWPSGLALPAGGAVITPHSLESVGGGSYLGLLSSGAWPTANRAFFIPFRLSQPATVTRVFWLNGSTVAGNVDVGVYDTAATLLVSCGATAQAGISTVQDADVTDTMIGPGLFYLGISLSSITGTISRAPSVPVTDVLRALGLAQMASAHPLPATATFATIAFNTIPLCGVLLRRTVV